MEITMESVAKMAGLEPVNDSVILLCPPPLKKELKHYRCDTCKRNHYEYEVLEPWVCGVCEGGTMVRVREEEI